MATQALDSRPPIGDAMKWLPVLLGILVLFVPTYVDLAGGLWQTDEHAHGPIVLLVAAFLIWQKRAAFSQLSQTRPLLGWALLVGGLASYVVGRSQDIVLLEVGAQVPVLLGVLLITLGAQAARALWFPLFFLLFIIPLPGFIVDLTTGPLKQYISQIAEHVLYAAGYPIARNGVVLHVGQYQLLVADACSGLHSMFSLSAMGLLYLYLMRHSSVLRNGLLIASIIPIAFLSNVIRVILLVLITYHMGDEAAQGFLHETAGILLFVIGLLLLFILDWLLGFVFPNRPARANKK